MQIPLINEHLFCKYFVRLSIGNVTKGFATYGCFHPCFELILFLGHFYKCLEIILFTTKEPRRGIPYIENEADTKLYQSFERL